MLCIFPAPSFLFPVVGFGQVCSPGLPVANTGRAEFEAADGPNSAALSPLLVWA